MSVTRLVVNVRGGTAYGKTTLARNFLKHKVEDSYVVFPGLETGATINRCLIPELYFPLFVLGPYDDSKYSGCDKIKSADAIENMVEQGGNGLPGHLLFEGFRVSKSWDRFAQLKYRLDKAHKARMLFMFLDMGLDLKTVVDRAQTRRNEGSREVDPEELKHVVKQMDNSCRKSRQLFAKDTVLIDAHLSAYEVYQSALNAMMRCEGELW